LVLQLILQLGMALSTKDNLLLVVMKFLLLAPKELLLHRLVLQLDMLLSTKDKLL
jgi:hypothetical protein